MNEHEHKPHSSSFVRRRQYELEKYLINEMELEPSVAHLLLHLHKPTSLRDVLFALFRPSSYSSWTKIT